MFLRAVYGIGEIATREDLDALLADRDIPILMSSSRVLGPLIETYVGHRGFMRRGLESPWDRWLKAEIVGHFALHDGDQTEMPLTMVAHQERQAHEFAGFLIWGDPAVTFDWPPYAVTTELLAEEARVPRSCVEKWWSIVGGELGAEPHYALMRHWHWARV